MCKIYFIISCVVLVLFGCQSPAFGPNLKRYSASGLHESLSVAWKKVSSYKYEKDPMQYWKSPSEFESEGCGDCEDFSTDLMYHLGPDSSLIIGKMAWMKDEPGYHAFVEYGGRYIEPQGYNQFYTRDQFEIYQAMEWRDAMNACTDFGTRQIAGELR